MAKNKSKSRVVDVPYDWVRHSALLQELEKETDRGLALFGAALLDEQVKEVIIRGLKPFKRALSHLFDYPGGLATASSCIELGFVLGLYGERTHSDLCVINDIRNRFAHTLTQEGTLIPLSFSDPEIIKACSSLSLLRNFTFGSHQSWQTKLSSLKTARDRFIHNVYYLALLMGALIHTEGLPRPKFWCEPVWFLP